MTAAMLAGCGSSTGSSASSETQASEAATPETSAAETAAEESTAAESEAESTAADTAGSDTVYNIGICQLLQHDALDQATQGFKDAMVELLGED